MNLFRSLPVRAGRGKWLLPLLAGLLLAGCTRNTVRTRFADPEFSRGDLRKAPSILVISRDVRVTDFRKSFDAVFAGPDSLAARLARKLRDSLNLGAPVVYARPADSLASARAAIDSARAAGAEYVIFVRGITVGSSRRKLPSMLLPGMNGVEPSGGGESESCRVFLEVEVLKSTDLSRLYAFTVETKAEVAFYAFKTALLNAVDGAARETASHLAGR